MRIHMNVKGFFTPLRRSGTFAALAAAPMLLGAALLAPAALAQYGPPPEGYGQYYHEQQGHPMFGARQGWAAGIAQGQSDRQQGHSNRPTHVDTYRHVPRSPDGYPRDQFAHEYRDAFVRGYERGYNGGGDRR
jgi:hypothetical protein